MCDCAMCRGPVGHGVKCAVLINKKRDCDPVDERACDPHQIGRQLDSAPLNWWTMKMPVHLPPETWDAIKTASIRGVTDRVICARYNLSPSTLSVKRHRDPVWRIAARKTKKKGEKLRGENEALSTLLVDNREAIAQENQVLLSQYIHGKIKNVITKDGLNEPENWAEMKTANDIFRKSVGLDKEQPAVSINFGWSTTGDSDPICEISLDDDSDMC